MWVFHYFLLNNYSIRLNPFQEVDVVSLGDETFLVGTLFPRFLITVYVCMRVCVCMYITCVCVIFSELLSEVAKIVNY